MLSNQLLIDSSKKPLELKKRSKRITANDEERVRQFYTRVLTQVFAARVHADDEVAGKRPGVVKGKFAVSRSQVQDDAVVVCESIC